MHHATSIHHYRHHNERSSKLNRPFIGVLLIALFFILVSYLTQTYNPEIRSLIEGRGTVGLVGYVAINAITIVVAPLTSIPLIPLAVSLWGPVTTALATIIGWQMGAIVAFWIARKYGRKVVKHFVSLEKVDELESRIPKKGIFWTVAVLQMITPVDIASYALGLFKAVKWHIYIPASFVGIIPLAFTLAYTGTLSLLAQLIIFSAGALILVVLWSHIFSTRS